MTYHWLDNGICMKFAQIVVKNIPSQDPVRSCFKAHFYSSHNIKQQTIKLEVIKGSTGIHL